MSQTEVQVLIQVRDCRYGNAGPELSVRIWYGYGYESAMGAMGSSRPTGITDMDTYRLWDIWVGYGYWAMGIKPWVRVGKWTHVRVRVRN